MTVAVNVSGSFLLGLLMSAGHELPAAVRSARCRAPRGFTTFSTFSVEVLGQIEAGEGGRALLYVLASVRLGLGGAAAGLYAGRALA